MIRRCALLSVALTAATVLLPACGGDDGATTIGGSGPTSGPGGTTSSGSGTPTSSGSGGTGSSSGGAGGASSSSSGSGGGAAGDHVLISEIGGTAPESSKGGLPVGGGFAEIYNPTAAAVDLTDYYISDNSTYVGIANGQAWNPITNDPGSDFLAQFPGGTMIPPGGVLVIATDPNYENRYNACPDFILWEQDFTCQNGSAKAMVAPTNGDLGSSFFRLAHSPEMLVLFTWDGDPAHVLHDVDYLTWGTMLENGTRADKTGVMGYQADTAAANQKPAPTPPNYDESIERCGPALENGETQTGGNGITGHDETSEDLATSFVIQTTPSPGVKNACLP